MPSISQNVRRALVRLPKPRLSDPLRTRSRQTLQRLARQTVQLLNARWPGWTRVLNSRQRQAVTVISKQHASRRAGNGPVDAAAVLDQLESGNWDARAHAAHDLGAVQGADATAALIAALRDPSAEVALAAIESLGARTGSEVTEALQDVLANGDGFFSPLTRAAALSALAPRLTDAEVPRLFEAIGDVDSEVSLAAIQAIARRKPAAASEKLLPVLQEETGYFLPPVRQAAAYALRNLGALSETERDQLLASETDPIVCEALRAPPVS